MALNIRALFGIGTSATTQAFTVNNSTATTLLNADQNRKAFVIFNASGTLYVKLGTSPSSSSFTYQVSAGNTLEVANYIGIVTAIKASGSTVVHVTSII